MDEEDSSPTGKWRFLSPDNEEDVEKIAMVTKMVKSILKMTENKEKRSQKDEWLLFHFKIRRKRPVSKPPNEEVPEGSTKSDAQTPKEEEDP